jgi:tubulin monoglycylase TTLL3/8
MDSNRINNTFELFGYDYMLDDELNTYLIEINNNPDISTCCPLLNKLIPAMVDNVFRLAVDPVFPPPHIT